MLISKGDRETAIHALINTWLKDKTKRCANCNETYNYHNFVKEPCCEEALIGTNQQILKRFSQELQHLRLTRANKYASLEDQSMRFGVSMPVSLYHFLDQSMQRLYDEKLITKEYDLVWFMKKFGKYFRVPEEI